MKKLLLTTAAVALGAVAFGSAAEAQGVKLGVGGHMKAYGVWHSQDSEYGVDNRSVDLLRTTEAHLSGETTLDNGLTVGAHMELLLGGNRWADDDDRTQVSVDESYLYMSGAWGRVNVGNEDGAAYLLQVAAPSADSNIDGIRQFINPFNASGISTGFSVDAVTGDVVVGSANENFFAPGITSLGLGLDTTVAGATGFGFYVADNFTTFDPTGLTYAANAAVIGVAEFAFFVDGAGVDLADLDDEVQDVLSARLNLLGAYGQPMVRKTDYAQDFVRGDDKLTYLTPVFQGFQAGVSWTPHVGGDTKSFGVRDETASLYEHAWDFGARYEGQFDVVGLTLGGGYSYAKLENQIALPGMDGIVVDVHDNGGLAEADQVLLNDVSLRNYKAWNLGANVAWTAFNLGVVYKRDNSGIRGDADNRTWVAGVDYTTGPFKIGASYLNEKQELGFALNPMVDADLKTTRWSGGLTYTYGPGMTFRGSIHHVDHESAAIRNSDSTSFLLGTQINF